MINFTCVKVADTCYCSRMVPISDRYSSTGIHTVDKRLAGGGYGNVIVVGH